MDHFCTIFSNQNTTQVQLLAFEKKGGGGGNVDNLAQSSYVDHSLAKPINVLSPSMGFPIAGLDAVKNHQSLIVVQMHDVSHLKKISSHNID